MVVSKPKIKAVFALGIFILLVYIALFMLLNFILGQQVFAWWLILLAGVVCALAFGLTIKSLNDFKTLRLSNNLLTVSSYLGLVKQDYPMDELKAWTEETVKTKSEPFVEITMIFSGKQFIKLNNQQDAGFQEFFKYLKKKKPKLKVAVK
ncbi:MAG: hypothetical protein MI784_11485 [Cytophagales bacterium]|nr:hypothetical protein [Cytophagales bacterium]